MQRIIERRIALWHGKVDIFVELTGLTLDVLARTMPGIEPDTPAYAGFLRHYWPLTLKQKRRAVLQARDALWHFYQSVVQQRRDRPGDDALSTLITATDAQSGAKISDPDLLYYAHMIVESGHSDLTLAKTYLTAPFLRRVRT
jgi:cytochrome P450